MPRIEIIPDTQKESDASPTVDCCAGCVDEFRIFPSGACMIPSRAIHDILNQGFGNTANSFRIGSKDVEHPPYADAYTECVLCGEVLFAVDD